MPVGGPEGRIYPLDGKRVWVAGHKGMVGSAIVRRMDSMDCEVLTVERSALDLRRQQDVYDWMASTRPDAVVLAAATVGGIFANMTEQGRFLFENLMIEANVIEGARLAGVEKLFFMGSACIYPRLAPQPMSEEALLTGPLEPTNEGYAVAKIAGIKLCDFYCAQYGCDFISAMPNNLYGPGDSFDPLKSHVIPALILKFHRAKAEGLPEVEIWGTGRPKREFLYVDDLADAAVFLLERYSGAGHVNIGSGSEVSIGELAERIAAVVGYEGRLTQDPAKPDGVPRKLLDSSRISAMGWSAKTPLDEGLAAAYAWFRDNVAKGG